MDMNYVALMSVSTQDVILRVILIDDTETMVEVIWLLASFHNVLWVLGTNYVGHILVLCTAVCYGCIIPPLPLIWSRLPTTMFKRHSYGQPGDMVIVYLENLYKITLADLKLFSKKNNFQFERSLLHKCKHSCCFLCIFTVSVVIESLMC